MTMTRIYLWALANPAIIVPAPTGIMYCNQVDGVATDHREQEGFLLPLPTTKAEIFQKTWWEENCNRRCYPYDKEIWQNMARAIEDASKKLISSGETPQNLRVIEQESNVEAWVEVEFDLTDVGTHVVQRMRGILTWENCD